MSPLIGSWFITPKLWHVQNTSHLTTVIPWTGKTHIHWSVLSLMGSGYIISHLWYVHGTSHLNSDRLKTYHILPLMDSRYITSHLRWLRGTSNPTSGGSGCTTSITNGFRTHHVLPLKGSGNIKAYLGKVQGTSKLTFDRFREHQSLPLKGSRHNLPLMGSKHVHGADRTEQALLPREPWWDHDPWMLDQQGRRPLAESSALPMCQWWYVQQHCRSPWLGLQQGKETKKCSLILSEIWTVFANLMRDITSVHQSCQRHIQSSLIPWMISQVFTNSVKDTNKVPLSHDRYHNVN